MISSCEQYDAFRSSIDSGPLVDTPAHWRPALEFSELGSGKLLGLEKIYHDQDNWHQKDQ